MWWALSILVIEFRVIKNYQSWRDCLSLRGKNGDFFVHLSKIDKIFVIRVSTERHDVGVDVGAAELEQRSDSQNVAESFFCNSDFHSSNLSAK